MNRRQFLSSSLAGTLGIRQAQPNREPVPHQAGSVGRQKPNILLLFADEFRFDALRCAGNRVIQTPNLDALAASGVRFTQACTPSPVCVAARMSLITGHRGSRTHWVANNTLPGATPEWPTIMTLLDAVGYRTHAVGKMHFFGRHFGLHQHESMEEVVDRRIDDDYLTFLRERGVRTRYPQGLRDLLYFQPQTSGLPVEYAQSTWVADRSIAFLRNHLRCRGNQPFFLWASWISPHPPFAPCEPYDSMYAPESMSLPYYADRPISSLPPPAWPHRARLDGAHRDPDRMRRIRALYYGQISHVDEAVGRVLGELKRLGLAENTAVIFTSDHGEMLGDHGLSQKFIPYEPSVRIPLLLRWPGRTRAGQVNGDLVGLTDILPTFIREIGLEYPKGTEPPHGESLLSAGGGGLPTARDAYFIDHGQGADRWMAVRTRTHKYVFWAAGGCEELHDMQTDPQERNNLAAGMPQLAADLRSRLSNWERQHGLESSFNGPSLQKYPAERPPESDPAGVVINEGRWPSNLPGDEREGVESYAEAFTRAIAREKTLSPEKLSIGDYKRKGGEPLTGTPWEDAWKRA